MLSCQSGLRLARRPASRDGHDRRRPGTDAFPALLRRLHPDPPSSAWPTHPLHSFASFSVRIPHMCRACCMRRLLRRLLVGSAGRDSRPRRAEPRVERPGAVATAREAGTTPRRLPSQGTKPSSNSVHAKALRGEELAELICMQDFDQWLRTVTWPLEQFTFYLT